MKYISDKNGIPTTPHCAALVFESIRIPADERSKSWPGHGYPESSESVVKYIMFDTVTEMEEWVKKQEASPYRRDNYRLIESHPLTIKHTIQVVK